MSARCPVTILPTRIACTLLEGHDGRHNGGGWLWWHGNGEGCAPGCDKCAAAREYDHPPT